MKYYICINNQENGNIIFEGYFVVNSYNIVVEVYETINGVTSTNNIIKLDRIIPNISENYLGFQIYDDESDYAYLPSWKQFDNYGIRIISASNYPQTNEIAFFSSNLGDEPSTNIGKIAYASEQIYIRVSVSYTIKPTNIQLDYPDCNLNITHLNTFTANLTGKELMINNTVTHDNTSINSNNILLKNGDSEVLSSRVITKRIQ